MNRSPLTSRCVLTSEPAKETASESVEEFTSEAAKDATRFDELVISQGTKLALEQIKMASMTPVQAKCIPAALAGHDVLGEAKTGSGKTLAFMVPVVELLLRGRFTARNGTGVIVLTPTHELALQILSVARDLLRHHQITFAAVMGGQPRHAEAERLSRGVNLLIATPGRLLDHLKNTSEFVFRNLCALVIDEADRILEVGFEDQMREIVSIIPRERQTLLFSATQTTKVDDLARASMRGKPVYISITKSDEDKSLNSASPATSEKLEQGYTVCESKHRFMLLYTFLKRNRAKKIIVFFSSCNSVRFHADYLNYVGMPVLELHGKKSQNQRTSTFFEFINAKQGILLCTNVAARGLDIPAVDWIVQYDPADDPREYIHRVGRTARAGASGRALLFLLPTELSYLTVLRNAGVSLLEFKVEPSKMLNVSQFMEKTVGANYHLNNLARAAFHGYVRAYASHSLKTVFALDELDLQQTGRAFGLKTPPPINLLTNGRKN